MSRRSKASEQGTAEDLELHYTITPTLVSSLGYARWAAGRVSALGLSFYGLRALQTDMMHLRIAEMTVACTFRYFPDDIAAFDQQSQFRCAELELSHIWAAPQRRK